MSDATSWVGIGIGVSSLIISIIAVWKSSWAQSEIVAAQKRIVAIEEQREKERHRRLLQAQLQPRLDKESYRLYLSNSGNAEAYNVKVILDGKPLNEHCAAVKHDGIPTRIGANSEVSCLLNITFGCAPPFEIEVEWDDASGTGRIYHGTLTF